MQHSGCPAAQWSILHEGCDLWRLCTSPVARKSAYSPNTGAGIIACILGEQTAFECWYAIVIKFKDAIFSQNNLEGKPGLGLIITVLFIPGDDQILWLMIDVDAAGVIFGGQVGQ